MIVEGELTCQEFVELATAYLEEALPPAERARFEAHFDECDDCPRYLEQMRQTIRLLGCLSEERLDPVARNEMLRVYRDWRRRG